MERKFSQMHDFLMKELKLMHFPVGMTLLYSEEDANQFKKTHECYAPVKPLTLCQAELGARMEGLNILLEMKKLWCKSARIGFGVKDIEAADIAALHVRFCESEEQAETVLRSKPRLTGKPPVAIALMPLGRCTALPQVVHFCCDNMQAYHLLNDWMVVARVHPLRPNLCVNSALCGGTVFTMIEQQANLTLACAGNYNSGKMERGEINVMIPGKDIEKLVDRMVRRKEARGGVSLTKLGNPFPGIDVCQNCPLISFRKIAQEP